MTNTKEQQLNSLEQAKKLASEYEYDQALDILTSGECGPKATKYFQNCYIRRDDLKAVTCIKGTQWGGSYTVDQLASGEWFHCPRRDGDTVYIAKTGIDLLYDVQNFIAIL